MENKILSLIHYGEKILKDAGISTAKYEAEVLLAHVLKRSRLKLYLDVTGFVPQEKEDYYKQLVKERAERKPLQYILGYADFYGLLDVGTGSGNIAISIAKNSSLVEIYAMDNNEKALELARHNAEENGVLERIHFFKMSIFDEYEKLKQTTGHVDIITSNPPYIPSNEIDNLMPEIKNYEPRYALDGGEDGLQFIRKIILIANGLLSYNGVLIMEIGDNQKENVQHFAKKYFSIDFKNDLNGKPRILIAEKRS